MQPGGDVGVGQAIGGQPQDVALAFYQAFENKDLDAMMAAWADDDS